MNYLDTPKVLLGLVCTIPQCKDGNCSPCRLVQCGGQWWCHVYMLFTVIHCPFQEQGLEWPRFQHVC